MSDRRCLIELERVTLRYPALPIQRQSIKDLVFARLGRPQAQALVHDVDALRDVTLTVPDGQRVAIIGPNGAGKSSLLKAVAGVYPLHEGRVRTVGGVQSLFELSLGFEPEASGRDNIAYRALLMGEPPARIRTREAEIISFADLGEFIDYPVKTYSAGMLVRLAFSISTAFGGEILLMDEVIGVGDAAFLAKARKRLQDLVSGARIVLYASHDMGTVSEICDRAIHLEAGRLVNDGPARDVVTAYLAGVQERA